MVTRPNLTFHAAQIPAKKFHRFTMTRNVVIIILVLFQNTPVVAVV